MNADKIKDMRDVARSLVGPQKSSPNLPVIAIMLNVAASELERLGKIEAAARDWFYGHGRTSAYAAAFKLAEAIEANSCPTK